MALLLDECGSGGGFRGFDGPAEEEGGLVVDGVASEESVASEETQEICLVVGGM